MDDHSATGYYHLFQIGWYAIGIAILQREREYNVCVLHSYSYLYEPMFIAMPKVTKKAGLLKPGLCLSDRRYSLFFLEQDGSRNRPPPVLTV